MDDLKTLKDYLSNRIVSPEAEQELIGYLNKAFIRIVTSFELISAKKNGKLSDIGANPYFLTLLIKKYKEYDSFANSGWRKISYELLELSYDLLSTEFMIKKSGIRQQRGTNADGRDLIIAIQEVRLV